MKIFKTLIITSLLILGGLSLSSCGGNKAADTAGKEYTSAYVCPMHCTGSGSDAEGKCPVCGMDYVAKAEHEKKTHTH